MLCDVCGDKEAIYNSEIEGTVIAACDACSKYGKTVSRIRKDPPKKVLAKKAEKGVVEEEEILELIIPDYSSRIKSARERKGLKQEEFAKRIHEKESVVHHLESGKMQPSIPLARKIERFLGLKLVEEHKEAGLEKKSGKPSGSLTLGDIALVRKKKK